LGVVAATLLGSVAGCGEDIGLPPPTFENVVDTSTFYALSGTPVWEPSAMDVVRGLLVRLDLGDSFDFAFDIDATAGALLLTAAMLGSRTEAGIAPQSVPFDSVLTAPEEGYVIDSVVPIKVGDVFVARSRFTQDGCQVAAQLPRYGKFEVLAIDPQTRTVDFKQLLNGNCGYRDLQPGLPVN
jgi:hypothetical protein